MAKINLNELKSTTKNVLETTEEDAGFLSFLNKDITLFSRDFNDKKREAFYSELHILFAAGVDISSALELIEDEQEKDKDKVLFNDIRNKVIGGAGLSQALRQTGKFSPYEYYSLQIGEESGQLNEVLNELAYFYSKKIQQRRQLISALSYPVVVFMASFGAIFFMMKFVVPMFADVFKRFKGDLPAFTKLVINFSEVFSAYVFYFIALMIVAIIIFYVNRNALWYRKFSANVLLRTPIVKEMISKIYLARFCQSMHLLIGSKIPLVTSIDLVQKMIGFYPIESSLDTVKEDIMKGSSLHSSLMKFPIFNRRLVSLLKVAEEVNEMDAMFSKLAKQYSDEVEHKTAVLGSLIEPVMIIFLGVLVAVILVAMYLPLFQMGMTVG